MNWPPPQPGTHQEQTGYRCVCADMDEREYENHYAEKRRAEYWSRTAESRTPAAGRPDERPT